MGSGTVILLNGTSSAGKTTLAYALQDAFQVPYLRIGLDQYLASVPRRYFVSTDGKEPAAAEGWLLIFRHGALQQLPRYGPLGYQIRIGMYRAVAALADAGLNVIVDDVIPDERILRAAVEALAERDILLVGVQCAVEEAVRRECERGDRAPGGASIFAAVVHQHALYDLEVDTTSTGPGECARLIKEAVEQGCPRQTLQSLRRRFALLPGEEPA